MWLPTRPADHYYRCLIWIGGFADQDDRLVDLAELRTPQEVGKKCQLLIGPQVVIKDLPTALLESRAVSSPARFSVLS